MKFTAKKIDLTLELEGLDGVTNSYLFMGKPGVYPNAKMGADLLKKFQEYESANQKKPESEMEGEKDVILEELKMVYPQLDKAWILENFTIEEIRNIMRGVGKGITGLKKD